MIINEDLINNFIQIQTNRGLKEKTIKRFRSDFMAFYRWLGENKEQTVEAIDKLTIENYKSFLKSKAPSKYGRYKKAEWISNVTINEKLIAIKHFLRFTREFYDIGLEPDKIKNLPEKSERMDYFTEEEVKEILKAVEKTEPYKINQLRLKLLITMCFCSWLRLSESQQITVEDILKWEAKIIWKGDKVRFVYFSPECVKLQMEYLEEQKKPLPRIWKPAKNYKEKHYAIIGHHIRNFGTPICKQTIQLAFEKLNGYLKRTKHITLHTLRHSFATNLMDKWANLSTIQDLMGHAKLSTTATYLHNNWENLKKEQQRVFSSFTL